MNVVPIALLVAIGFATDANKAGASEPESLSLPATYDLKVAPQELGAALQELARQSGSQIIFFSRLTDGLTTAGLEGAYTLPEALGRLLADSGLTFRQLSEQSFEVRPISREEPGAVARTVSSPVDESVDSQKGLPEILVTGARGNLNLDIERTEDDVLPYVVFNRREVQQSGYTTVEDFLKYRLPMNAMQNSNIQRVGTVFGSRGQANLRGFGTNQTLILMDGRRTTTSLVESTLMQQDLNGIPLASVERIEVLPTSASGIYGGDATGGVINIVLRRDFQGAELSAGYDNVFDGDDRKRNASFVTGFELEGGKTNVSLVAFWSDSEMLLREERGFIPKYRDEAFANRPALWLPPSQPPLGYTTNIVSLEGNLTLDDGTPLNSMFTSVPVGYAGAATDGGAALVVNAGRYNFDLAESSQIAGQWPGGRAALLNSPSLKSFNATIRRDFGARVNAFLDVTASDGTSRGLANNLGIDAPLAADAPNNPFQQEILVNVPIPSHDFMTTVHTRDRRVVSGVIADLPREWRSELDFVWHRSGHRASRPGFIRDDAFDLLDASVNSDPAFAPLRDTNIYPLDLSPFLTELTYDPFETTTKDLTLLSGGPLGSLPGGRPSLSVRLGYRQEDFGGGTFKQSSVTPFFVYPDKSQTVMSAVAELRVPLVSVSNRVVFAHELELQLSGRWDDYRSHGSEFRVSSVSTAPIVRSDSELHSVNPAVGLRWKPVEDVAIRASYGTGFLPPNVTQLTPNSTFTFIPANNYTDPRRGNLPIGNVIQTRAGGNPDLEPEKSESWSAGVIYTPRWLQGMRLSVDFTNIERTDRIATHPLFGQGLINDEALFPDRVRRGTPTATEAALGWPGPVTFLDATLVNIASARTEACEVQFDYRFETGSLGTFGFYGIGTWNQRNELQTMADAPAVDNVGFTSGVLDYNINGGMTWNRRGLTFGWNVRYLDSYLTYPAFPVPLTPSLASTVERLVQIQGSTKVDSQVYHDAFATYRFERLNGSEITLGISNVLNSRPPRSGQSYSPYGDPRLASYHLGFKMVFD